MHPLHSHIKSKVLISIEEFEGILTCCKYRRLKKNQLLLQEGEYCKADFFVLSGCLRQYYLNEKGKEHVVQFAFTNWWISDWYSILHSQPSAYTIEALEYAEVLQLNFEDLQRLFTDVPTLEKYFRIMFQYGFAAQQRRILGLQKPALERYRAFLSVYGYFEKKLPQAQIASYLGITRESLSRIKKQLNGET